MAELAFANLRGAYIGGANLKHADLWKAHLDGTSLYDARFEDAYLGKANLRDAKINEHTNFKNANLEEAIWINGIVCEKGSIGKCIQDGKEVYVYKDPMENRE